MFGWLAGPPVPSTLGFMNAGPSLSLAEWTVLALIAEHPAHGFAISQLTAPGGELGRIWHIPRPVIYRAIGRLEEAGLVERVRDPEDRRAWRLHVTDKAQPLIEKLQGVGAQLVERAFSGIEPNDLETTRRVLAQARENAARPAATTNRASNQ